MNRGNQCRIWFDINDLHKLCPTSPSSPSKASLNKPEVSESKEDQDCLAKDRCRQEMEQAAQSEAHEPSAALVAPDA